MNFIEAHKITSNFQGGEGLPYVFALSGTYEPFDLFLKAAAAQKGWMAKPEYLPFNTLKQTLAQSRQSAYKEVFVLFPWDFIGEYDWRSGIPEKPLPLENLIRDAQWVADKLRERENTHILFAPVPVPPIYAEPLKNAILDQTVRSLATEIGSVFLEPNCFGLSSYLSTGCPIGGKHLGPVAIKATDMVLNSLNTNPRPKVLVTDLDNVMWNGVVGEDGFDEISYTPEGKGYKHYLYQTMLKRLKQSGIILAAVSRNDPEDALPPFQTNQMCLNAEDFASIIASYNPKSSQIIELSHHLNLCLASFVFIDDNDIELAEVKEAVPDITCLKFPENDEKIPDLLTKMSEIFACKEEEITDEDLRRTEMYKTRLKSLAPVVGEGGDLTEFLANLQMTLKIHDRSKGDRSRAIQLINKTNQFNLNGRRQSDEYVGDILGKGGRLLTASLSDRHGGHGEVLACLITEDEEIESLVMSCRVFQRRAEYAFISWILSQPIQPCRLQFEKTNRNEPFRMFIDSTSFDENNGKIEINAAQFLKTHEKDFKLFTVIEP